MLVTNVSMTAGFLAMGPDNIPQKRWPWVNMEERRVQDKCGVPQPPEVVSGRGAGRDGDGQGRQWTENGVGGVQGMGAREKCSTREERTGREVSTACGQVGTLNCRGQLGKEA